MNSLNKTWKVDWKFAVLCAPGTETLRFLWYVMKSGSCTIFVAHLYIMVWCLWAHKIYAETNPSSEEDNDNVLWFTGTVIHTLLLKSDEFIDADRYCSQFDTMYQNLRVMRPRLINKNEVLLIHDRARPQVSRTNIQKSTQLAQWDSSSHCMRPRLFSNRLSLF